MDSPFFLSTKNCLVLDWMGSGCVHLRDSAHMHRCARVTVVSARQCWAPSSIVASVVMEITPRKYDFFYEVEPDRPTLLYVGFRRVYSLRSCVSTVDRTMGLS